MDGAVSQGPTPPPDWEALAETTEQLARYLDGHSLDTMSQDSGQRCQCGSDSRFLQWEGIDPPWTTIDMHRAQLAVRFLVGHVRAAMA